MTTSKFCTGMSWSNDNWVAMSSRASAASVSNPINSSVSSASTGVISRDCGYQSCGFLLSGFSASWPLAYRM